MIAARRAVDALVAEIGSTTTVVSAFEGLVGYPDSEPRLLAQGFAPTSVADGDVGMGVDAARAMLEAQVGGPLAPAVTLATSSAAGGLRMTVHGLTARMTAMAAREAALGAGAVVKYQTSGRLRDADLRRIAEARPQPDPARRRRGRRRLRHGAPQRRAPARAAVPAHRRVRRQLDRGRRGARHSPVRRLQGARDRQRLPGHRRARHRARPRRHPRRVRGAHHACAGHGAHRRVRERPHPAHAGGRAHRRRAARDRGGRPRGRRRGRRDHRRPLDHRRQPGDRGDRHRARTALEAHRRGRPRHVRERLARRRDAPGR